MTLTSNRWRAATSCHLRVPTKTEKEAVGTSVLINRDWRRQQPDRLVVEFNAVGASRSTGEMLCHNRSLLLIQQKAKEEGGAVAFVIARLETSIASPLPGRQWPSGSAISLSFPQFPRRVVKNGARGKNDHLGITQCATDHFRNTTLEVVQVGKCGGDCISCDYGRVGSP